MSNCWLLLPTLKADIGTVTDYPSLSQSCVESEYSKSTYLEETRKQVIQNLTSGPKQVVHETSRTPGPKLCLQAESKNTRDRQTLRKLVGKLLARSLRRLDTLFLNGLF